MTTSVHFRSRARFIVIARGSLIGCFVILALLLGWECRGDKPSSNAGLSEQEPQKTAAELYREGNWLVAEQHCKVLVRDLEDQMGRNHFRTLEAKVNLAELQRSMAHFRQAESTFSEALAIQRDTHVFTNQAEGVLLGNLALLHCDMGDYDKAEQRAVDSCQLLGNALGNQHPSYANSLCIRGSVQKMKGNWEAARALYMEAKAIVEGKRNAVVVEATVLNNLADLNQTLGNPAEAKRNYNASLELLAQGLGDSHPQVSIVRHNLATLNREEGNFDDALVLDQKCVEALRKELGVEHPLVAVCLNGVAETHLQSGRLDLATASNEEATQIVCRTVGEAHPLFASCLRVHAGILTQQHRFAKSEASYLRALQIQDRVINRGEAKTKILKGLMLLYEAQAREDDASRIRNEIALLSTFSPLRLESAK